MPKTPYTSPWSLFGVPMPQSPSGPSDYLRYLKDLLTPQPVLQGQAAQAYLAPSPTEGERPRGGTPQPDLMVGEMSRGAIPQPASPGTGLGSVLADRGAPTKQPPRSGVKGNVAPPAAPGNPPGETTRRQEREETDRQHAEAPLPVGPIPPEGQPTGEAAKPTAGLIPSTTQDQVTQDIGFMNQAMQALGLGTIDPATGKFSQKDWSSDVQKRLGPPPAQPADPEQTYRNPWVQAAILAPAAVGALTGGGLRGFSGSAAALEGLLGGQAQQKLLYEQGLGSYQDRLMKGTELAEQQGTRAAQAFLPYLLTKRADDLRFKAAQLHNQILTEETAVREQASIWAHSDRVAARMLSHEDRQAALAEKRIMDGIAAKLGEARVLAQQGNVDGANAARAETAIYHKQYLDILRARVTQVAAEARNPLADLNALTNLDKDLQLSLDNLEGLPGGEMYVGQKHDIEEQIVNLHGIISERLAKYYKEHVQTPTPVAVPTGATPAVPGPAKWTPPKDAVVGHDKTTGRPLWKTKDGVIYDENGNVVK